MDRNAEIRQGETGMWLSLLAYIILSLTKVTIGYFFDSEALTADGMNNSTDIIASAAVLVGLKISRKPPDHDHPYGHSRAESIASLIASFIMASVGLQVLVNSVKSVSAVNETVPDLTAFWVAVISALLMYAVSVYNRQLAKRINSQAVMAAAQDNRSDAWVSIGAAIGIMGAQFGLPWLDPLAAFIVGVMICKTAWNIFRGASHTLTDGFDDQKLMKLKSEVEKTPGVESIRDIKARIYGNRLIIDVVIEVNPQLNVVESHQITELIEQRMRRFHQVSSVNVHVEPGNGNPTKAM